MLKVKVTLLSGIPTILPWMACTVGRTDGRGGEGEEEDVGRGERGGRGSKIIKGTTQGRGCRNERNNT